MEGDEKKRLYKAVGACLKSSETPLKYYEFLLQAVDNLGENGEEEVEEAVKLALSLVEVKDFDEIVDLKGVKELSKVEFLFWLFVLFCFVCKRRVHSLLQRVFAENANILLSLFIFPLHSSPFPFSPLSFSHFLSSLLFSLFLLFLSSG